MYRKFIISLLCVGLIHSSDHILKGISASVIKPSDLVYVGAFRLPDSPSTPDNIGWKWSNWSAAATSYPGGDPTGPNDGYPGSLFAIGHDHTQYVSEISIPVPVKSASKNINALNMARTLQSFYDIKGSLYGYIEMPRVGLEYLPAQGAQKSGKLYFCWSQHLDEGNTGPTHGWCELKLSSPRPKGIWRIGGWENYLTADYIFEIPSAWAKKYTPNNKLATGRYRDGGQAAQGPALFTLGPWNQGNPPRDRTTLAATPLLLYDNVLDPAPQKILNGYAHSDEWIGGAWLATGEKSAVVFIGNKGIGYTWYGCVDEQECPPNCDCGETRGWWSNRIQAQMLFYDPADLVKVIKGTMQPNQPQPYAIMNLDPYLYHIISNREKHHVSAVAYDRPHGLLYIFEPFANGEKPIVHVWKLSSQVTSPATTMAPIFNLLLEESKK